MWSWIKGEKAIPVTALLFSLLLLIAVGAQFVGLGGANPSSGIEEYLELPVIHLHSPANGTYANNVLLNFTITKPTAWLSTPISFSYTPGSGLAQKLVAVTYNVDGEHLGTVAANTNLSISFTYFSNLPKLSSGVHRITITAFATGVIRDWISDTVSSIDITAMINLEFAVDATAPTVTVLSLEKTYETPEFPLNFSVNELTSRIYYVMDGKENVTISGNVTLSGLSRGTHNVTVYAEDMAGNIGPSETVSFTIASPDGEPEPFLSAPVAAASAASIGLVGVGVLVYFRKRRRHAASVSPSNP